VNTDIPAKTIQVSNVYYKPKPNQPPIITIKFLFISQETPESLPTSNNYNHVLFVSKETPESLSFPVLDTKSTSSSSVKIVSLGNMAFGVRKILNSLQISMSPSRVFVCGVQLAPRRLFKTYIMFQL
jgi:hypothetical protein